MSLKVYNKKRKFSETPEPVGSLQRKRPDGPLRFVIQLHRASRLHYDFRLEFDGVFKSWAVPRGPSLNPQDQRLAIFVEDHPLEYGSFEGVIPKGNYGAGTVMIWDQGTYVERGSQDRKSSEAAMIKGFAKGHLTFLLNGEKLQGEFALIRFKNADEKSWLLVKKRDAFSTYKHQNLSDLSVKSGRSLEKIASQSEKAGDIWLPKRKIRSFEKKSSGSRSSGSEKPRVTEKAQSVQKSVKYQKRSLMEEAMPRRNKPMIALASRRPMTGHRWLVEEDPEGLRAIAEVEGLGVHIYSKALLPFEKKFPKVLDELKLFKHKMVLDGKVIDKKGGEVFQVFDILYFDGKDLRQKPLEERKKF